MGDSPDAFYDALNTAGLEYAVFSCNGVDLFGDRESIDALKRWHHEAGTVPQLSEALTFLRARCEAYMAALEKIESHHGHARNVAALQAIARAALRIHEGSKK